MPGVPGRDGEKGEKGEPGIVTLTSPDAFGVLGASQVDVVSSSLYQHVFKNFRPSSHLFTINGYTYMGLESRGSSLKMKIISRECVIHNVCMVHKDSACKSD